MIPQAAFQQFFASEFQRALDRVEIPGLDGASWDRKAAWLLWLATDEGRTFVAPTDKSTDVGSIFD